MGSGFCRVAAVQSKAPAKNFRFDVQTAAQTILSDLSFPAPCGVRPVAPRFFQWPHAPRFRARIFGSRWWSRSAYPRRAAAAPVTSRLRERGDGGAEGDQPVRSAGHPRRPDIRAGHRSGLQRPLLRATDPGRHGPGALGVQLAAAEPLPERRVLADRGILLARISSTDSVDFWIATPGHTLANTTVITTAFDGQGAMVKQEETTLLPQASTTYKNVAIASGAGVHRLRRNRGGDRGWGTRPPPPKSASCTAPPTSRSMICTYDPPSSPPESSFLLGANPTAANLVAGGRENAGENPGQLDQQPQPLGEPGRRWKRRFPAGSPEPSRRTRPRRASSATLTLHAAKNAPIGPCSLDNPRLRRQRPRVGKDRE